MKALLHPASPWPMVCVVDDDDSVLRALRLSFAKTVSDSLGRACIPVTGHDAEVARDRLPAAEGHRPCTVRRKVLSGGRRAVRRGEWVDCTRWWQ